MAMSDSLLSTQMHQSVINNVIQRLNLNGKTYTLRDLYRTVSDKLGATQRKVPEELPGNVVVQFTKKDPANVRFADGKATIVLNLAKLQIGKKLRWRNFSIAVNYVPDSRTLDAKFIRVPDPDHVDSFIYIDGIRRSGHRMLVAGIFEKLFSSDRPISVFPENLTSDRRLSDVCVSQFEIADGWVRLLSHRAEDK